MDRVEAISTSLIMELLPILEAVVGIEVVTALSYAPLVSVNTINNCPRIWPLKITPVLVTRFSKGPGVWKIPSQAV